MSKRLTDKVAVVTGGASGIGEATVRKFVAEGAKVVIGDLNKERGQALAEELGDAAIFVAIDVTKASDWEEVKKQALEAFGTVDVLVNNAGISVAQSLLTMTEEQYRKILEINQVSVFLGMQKIAPIMIEKGAGSIINTSSIN
ncbi:SDR family NAD(P)-dependent oxidoreductase, partial [Jeotgalibaca porci]